MSRNIQDNGLNNTAPKYVTQDRVIFEGKDCPETSENDLCRVNISSL